ncbi:Gfo/Idh/MocA family protein [Volucribacter amazonae]|uniref:Oxidoreductase n=1 Tax=Volucribacter amazonae TaxID=256731 RepID=A0A9X4PDA8_9PAST|nr:Gfo/Idh/MocA family oxidoreductase [Volucribacter amazonae]MDG6895281.1 oxidoreductase [Volucribacter amazonae]
MTHITTALVGCGFFGQQLAQGFTKANSQLIGVTDIDKHRAQQLAEKFNTQAYTDIHQLLKHTTPDLLLIATPNYAHQDPAMIALNHNCHLFIETPFVIDPKQGQQIINLAQQKQKQIFVGHLLRTLPGLLKAKQIITQNQLGKITVARANRQRWIDSSTNKHWWKNDIKLTGGKLFNEIHELDLLCWLLGDVHSVYAQATNIAHLDTPENHDIIQLLLRFNNGIFASLEMGTAYRLHEWGIAIHGELGALVVNFFTSTMTLTLSNGHRQQFNLFDEFEADLSLRESSKNIQRYHEKDTLAPLWLSRAVEIEAENIINHLLGKQHSVLTNNIMFAVSAANAASLSIKQQKLILLSN